MTGRTGTGKTGGRDQREPRDTVNDRPGPLPDNGVIVLGLLDEGPAHPYDLNKTLEERGYRNWTSIGFSSIYTILSSLEKDGLVEVRSEIVASRPRKVYHITAAGKKRFSGSIKEILVSPRRPVFQWSLGLAHMPRVLACREQVEALRLHRQQLVEDLAFLEARAGDFPDDNIDVYRHTYHVRALFDHPACLVRASIAFVDDLIERIGRIAGTTVEPGRQ